MSLKVIGAGYGRTGTKSLQEALQILGFGKCYHMEELLRNPQGVKFWKSAYKEEKTDWNVLFKDYSSIVDFPGSMYYKELYKSFPESKVILTIRDPESWYQSVRTTIFSFDPGFRIKLKLIFKMPFSRIARDLFKVIRLNQKSIWHKYFEGRFEDKEFAIDKFNRHIEEVRENITEDKLLIFNSKDGWDPLCKFLNVSIPDVPYPYSNKKVDFTEWARGIVNDTLS